MLPEWRVTKVAHAEKLKDGISKLKKQLSTVLSECAKTEYISSKDIKEISRHLTNADSDLSRALTTVELVIN